MGATNIGNQSLFGKYATAYKANTLKNTFDHIVSPGIQYRDAEPYVDGTEIKVPPFKVAIHDKAGSTGIVLINTSDEVNITPIAGDDHIICRFEYIDLKENYADIIAIDSTALLATDIVLANISTSPLSVDSVPLLNRFDDELKFFSNHAAMLSPVSDFTNTPPPLVEGLRILVGDAGTGVFSGHNYELAIVESGVWRFYIITQTSMVLDEDYGVYPNYLTGNTALGFISLSNLLPHDFLQQITVDDYTLPIVHLSGGNVKKLLGGEHLLTEHFHSHDDCYTITIDDYTLPIVHLSGANVKKLLGGEHLLTEHFHSHDDCYTITIDDYTLPIVHLSGGNVKKLLGGETLAGEHYHLGLLTELQANTLAGGPASNADGLHKHAQYAAEPSSVLQRDNSQYVFTVGNVAFTTNARILEHPKYILAWDYTNGHLYVFDKSLTLLHDIDTTDTNLVDNYGWYLDYVMLYKYDNSTGDIYIYLADIEAGTIAFSNNFGSTTLIGNDYKMTDAVCVNNAAYFLFMGVKVTTQTHYGIAVMFDFDSLTLSQTILEAESVFAAIGYWGGITVVYDNTVYVSWISAYRSNMIAKVAYHAYSLSFALSVADSMVTILYSKNESETVNSCTLDVFSKVVNNTIEHFLYYFHKLSGGTEHFEVRSVQLTLDSFTLTKNFALYSAYTTPNEIFSMWRYDWGNKSKETVLDNGSVELFDFGSMTSLGTLNTTLYATKDNIVGSCVADRHIFVVINDPAPGTDKVYLWVLAYSGELLSVFEICSSALTAVDSARLKVINNQEMGLRILLLNTDDDKLYQVTLIRLIGDM